MSGKRVLITGGSGFFGINLARYLHGRGYEINVLDLVDFDYPDMNDKVKFFNGDIRNEDDVRKSMRGCDFVVHTAAALPLYKPEDIRSTDLGGTETILKTALDLKVKRMVHISSTAVYGIPDHHPLFEDDKLDGVGPYGESKVAAEALCAKYREKGLVVPILRPKSFIGPERLGVFAIYYDWIRRGKNIPIVGWGKNRYQLLDVEDLCEATRLCLEKPDDVVNDVFNIGAKEFTTMREDFGAVLDYAGYGKRIIGTPAKPLIWVLRILEALKLSPLYRWVYETAPEDSFVSVEKAEKKLGFTPKYSNKQALVRNYNWYLKHYDEFSGQSGVTHRVPWKQGILKVVSWFF
ncbi:MAG TPA: NAD(P)-dependent oxidoreductase [Candidatus Altiarchaeales archaeon]|nr:NAD(P)-dependent oxidoreductase [Candidatus Altiarchaeales archaeon]